METQTTIKSRISMRNKCRKLIFIILLSPNIFNLTTFAQKAKLIVPVGHTQMIYSVAFSPDGKRLVSGGDDGSVILWDTEKNIQITTLAISPDPVLKVVFSFDGKFIAYSASESIKLLDAQTGALVKTFSGHTDHINSFALSSDSKKMLTAGADKMIKLWDVDTGVKIKSFSGHSDEVHSVAFARSGNFFVSGSSDKTIKIWDSETGKILRTLSGHTDKITSVGLNSNDKIIASASEDNTIRLWNIETGKELKTLLKSSKSITALVFSPNGKILAGTGEDNIIRLWNVETGEEIKHFNDVSKTVFSLNFSFDGKQLIGANDDSKIIVRDIETGKVTNTLGGHSDGIVAIAYAPETQIIASATNHKKTSIWNLSNGQQTKTIPGGAGFPTGSIGLNFNGKQTVAVADKNIIKLVDAATGKEIKQFIGHTKKVMSVACSPKGKIIASGGFDKTVKLWNAQTGDLLATLNGHNDLIFLVTFSPDGRFVASSSSDKTVKIWSVESKKILHTLSGHKRRVLGIAFSPDGKQIVSTSSDQTIKLWNIETGKEIKTINDKGSSEIYSVAFSPDGKKIVTGAYDYKVKIWDVETGNKLQTLIGHTNVVNSVAFSPDGKWIFSGSFDASTKIWDVKSGKELVSLIALDENDWAVVTPEGLFDASPGARKLMHYVVGLEPINLEQMKDVYYVPGLLKKIFKNEPLPKVELFSKKDLFPSVAFSQPKTGQKDLTVKLTNRGGGIGQVQVLVNGKEFIKDARPADFDVTTNETTLTVNLKDAPLINGAENKIEVIARNASGSLTNRGTSRGTEIINFAENNGKTETPNIYAIVGGISNYTGDNLKLNFAAKDAEEMAKAIEIGATKLLGDQSKVHIRLLTSDGADSNVKFTSADAKISTATKDNFQKAFADFKNATPNDVFIVYLAGHGVALNLNQNPNQAGGDTYLYLTQEATTTDKSVLAIENSRQAMAISSEELKDLMKQNKALKQVLILDTCASGQAAQSFVQKRDLPSDQIRAIERLKDNTGFYVLMGSAADAVSYEASQYGQGLLTYSLLQGMKGAKLRENQFADVSLLFDYAQTTVPQMAKNIGGIQQPRIITPDTSRSFDIGKFTGEEQKQINLSNPKPIFLTPTLFNPAANRDNLKLSKMMAEQLRTLSYISARGANSSIVYVETDEMVDGIQSSGSYTVEGDTLKISVILVKNNQPIGDKITVAGNVNESEKLIKQLVKSVTQSF